MNKKKKVLYIITKSNFGGAQRYVFDLATDLPTDRFDVVVAFGGHGMLEEKLREARIRTHTIASFERDIDIGKESRAMFELWKLIREERPDIVHLNSSKAGGSGAFVARLLGVPRIIFTAHGWPFFEDRSIVWKIVVWLFSWFTALLAHKVILVSEHDRLRAHMPFVATTCSVIHTAVPEIDFMARDDARERLFDTSDVHAHASDVWLVTNAELTRNKNIAFAVRCIAAWNRGHERKIFYSIIGDGELKGELETLIKSLGEESQIKLLGYVPDARRYLKTFDVFLLPSLKEGMPYALLEAGAAGLYAIASNVGGIPEIIEHGKNGFLIDPKDPTTLTRAFDSFEKAGSMGKSLQEKVSSQFSLTEMLESTYELYA